MTVTNGAQLPSSEFVSRALDGEALAQLQAVLARVEQGRGTLVRLADLMGGAMGQVTRLGMRGLGMAPTVQHRIEQAAEKALWHAFDVAIVGMAKEGDTPPALWRENASQAVVAVSGALGGFGGIFGLAPDIGVTTLTIMREIARIAREEGEDLTLEETRHACLEVFALRSFPSRNSGEEGELGFFSARALLRGRPIVMLMSEVAAHYGIGLSRKFALQMVPVAGALCGAALNTAFLSHYRALARAHFTIRRLERTHGRAVHDAAVDLHAAGPEASETF